MNDTETPEILTFHSLMIITDKKDDMFRSPKKSLRVYHFYITSWR